MSGKASLNELTEAQLRSQLSKLSGASGYKTRLEIEGELERRGLKKSTDSAASLSETTQKFRQEPSSENQSLYVENYDPNIICQYAKQLLKSADSMVATWTIYGLIGGGVAGAVIPTAVGFENLLFVGSGITAVVGGMWGNSVGSSKAFLLRLDAQKALCQVQMEMNTRRVAEVNVGNQ